MRGWVPPDDRLWRHPSESGVRGSAQAPIAAAPRTGRDPPGAGWSAARPPACLLMVVATGVIMATHRRRPRPEPPRCRGHRRPDHRARDLSRSTDRDGISPASNRTCAARPWRSWWSRGPGGTSIGTGVVAEAGGIIVTLQPVVAGARSITAVEPDGTRAAGILVGTDPTTGIAVLHIDDDLPAADFSDGDPTGGHRWSWPCPSGPAAVRDRRADTRLYAGTVRLRRPARGHAGAPGSPPPRWPPRCTADDLGCPLVDRPGTVVGILAR